MLLVYTDGRRHTVEDLILVILLLFATTAQPSTYSPLGIV